MVTRASQFPAVHHARERRT